MVLRLAAGALITPALRRAAAQARRAALVALGLAMATVLGAGLLGLSAVLALSAWIGPVAATAASGGALLLGAALVAALRRRRSGRPAPQLPAVPGGANSAAIGLASGAVILAGLLLLARLRRRRP